MIQTAFQQAIQPRFDPIDPEEVKRWNSLSNGARLETMLHARALAVGLIRGQLRRQHPEISERELNLLMLKELEIRAKRKIPRF